MLFKEHDKENSDVYRTFFSYLVWTLLFVGLILVYMWQNINVADLEYKYRKLNEQVRILEKEHKELETEVTYLSTPERIGKIATERLGLVPINEDDIIWIASEKDRRVVSVSSKW